MMFFYNKFWVFVTSILSNFGRGYNFKKNLFNCELILKRNFKEKTNFSFIQVGANDGVSFDFLYSFVINRKSRGVVIEPIVEYFEDLVKNYVEYPNIVKVNKAVHKTNKSINIYKIDSSKKHRYPEWVKGLASFDKAHHLKTGIDTNDIIEEEVLADTLMNIINENYTNKKLDFFQIDTEGYDFEVLKMLDFSEMRPKIIKYESVNLKIEEVKELKVLLKQKKYYSFVEKGDTIAVDLERIRLI